MTPKAVHDMTSAHLSHLMSSLPLPHCDPVTLAFFLLLYRTTYSHLVVFAREAARNLFPLNFARLHLVIQIPIQIFIIDACSLILMSVPPKCQHCLLILVYLPPSSHHYLKLSCSCIYLTGFLSVPVHQNVNYLRTKSAARRIYFCFVYYCGPVVTQAQCLASSRCLGHRGWEKKIKIKHIYVHIKT